MFAKLLQCKKYIIGAAVALLLIGGTAVTVKEGMYYFLNVDGYVTAIKGEQVTISTKLYDRVVDFSDSYIDPAQALAVGDKVKIDKNFSGVVIGLKNESRRALNKAAQPAPERLLEGSGAITTAPAFDKAAYRPSSIAAASRNRAKGEKVVVEGTLVSRISDDDYLMQDGAGNNIIIDFEDGSGDRLQMQSKVKVYGRIDPKRTRVELEADHAEILP